MVIGRSLDYGTDTHKPDGQWDRVAEDMLLKYAQSGHLIFRATGAFERGDLKSVGNGKTTSHFCSGPENIDVVFRTVISVNQLSIYGTVSEMCEDSCCCFRK